MNKLSAKYVLRFDDVCPTMNWEKFSMIADICDDLGIVPILGVVPDTQDAKLIITELNTSFWDFVKTKALDGWIIAQHGYQHLYLKHKKTEFAGLPYHEQYKKIQLGQEILKEKLGFAPVWWMAPAHSFDKATCNALKDLGFEYITDGIALYPYKKYGLTWIPQQLWRPRAMPFGTWTICLHTNTMTAQGIQDMIEFMKKNKAQFQDVSLQPKKSLCNIAFKIIWGTMYISRRL